MLSQSRNHRGDASPLAEFSDWSDHLRCGSGGSAGSRDNARSSVAQCPQSALRACGHHGNRPSFGAKPFKLLFAGPGHQPVPLTRRAFPRRSVGRRGRRVHPARPRYSRHADLFSRGSSGTFRQQPVTRSCARCYWEGSETRIVLGSYESSSIGEQPPVPGPATDDGTRDDRAHRPGVSRLGSGSRGRPVLEDIGVVHPASTTASGRPRPASAT